MEPKRLNIPRAKSTAGTVVQSDNLLPPVTTKELQEWFACEERYRAELSEWSAALRRVFEDWSTGIPLSPEKVQFLARAYTAYFDTPVNFVRAGMNDTVMAQFDRVAVVAQLERVMREVVGRDEAKAKEAWVQLEKAFSRQISEARAARLSGRIASMDTLRDFYGALDKLKEAVKTHSATPEHRLQDDPERDQTIYWMRREGKTYGEIALELPKQNERWKITAKHAERLEKRYRERGQMQLYNLFLKAFGQSGEEKPR
jgi:hypothetical protein